MKARRILSVTGVLALLALVAAFAAEPLFWKRYATGAIFGFEDPPHAFFAPRALVAGPDLPGLPRLSPPEAGVDAAALDAAASYAEARGSDALLVSRRGHMIFERYWRGASDAALVNTHTFAATLAALAIGTLRAEAKIGSLDESAATYVAEWRDDARRAITIRDLLRMSSGLEPPGAGRAPWSPAMRAHIGTDLLARHLQAPLAGRPGAVWSYQPADPQILALIVERASGARYAEYLSASLWRRLGAANAYLWLDREDGTAHASCCLLARRGDWMRIAELLVADGVYQGEQILPPGWAREMASPARGDASFGYQLWRGADRATRRRGEAYAADDVLVLEGAGRDRLWVVPSSSLAILRTGKVADSKGDRDDARIPNLILAGVLDRPRTVPAPSEVDPADFAPGHDS
jgi:CubicO group peptidase (beta-lactamase class C family)